MNRSLVRFGCCNLIKISFDQPWLTTRITYSAKIGVSGYLGYSELIKPKNLVSLSKLTLTSSAIILNRIIHQHQRQDLTPVENFLRCIRTFDRLSDTLCRIIDLAETIRNLDPNQEWVEAANQAHNLLSRYMNTLNTHQELYKTLESSLSRLSHLDQHHPDLFAAKTVALQFLRDFQRHGIHLPSNQRRQLVTISDQILTVGRSFFAGTIDRLEPTWLTKSEAAQIGPSFLSSLEFDHHGRAEIDPSDWHAYTLLRQHPDQSIRHRIWLSQRQSSPDQVERLEALLQLRHQFARLTGKENWAQVILEDKMVANPQNVIGLLDRLATQTKPIALNELHRFQNLSSCPLQTWDRDYYGHLLDQTSKPRASPRASNLSAYFSVGSCLQGLSELFTRIYGISFQVVSPEGPNEIWHDSVVKLAVVDEQEGRLGTIYCDLFEREGKSPGAAHYTVRCSRRTDLDEEHLDLDFLNTLDPHQPLLDDIFPSQELHTPLASPGVKRPGLDGLYQQPIVVFSCSFTPPNPHTRQPSLLAWSEVETLFHEMGHAMHSMIGQTEYHNVSGTRCATDYVELPSILMEHFARSPEVLSLFANHYSDERRGLDMEVFQEHIREIESQKATETHGQIVLAILDQHFHSSIVAQPSFDSTSEYARLIRQYDLFSTSSSNDGGGGGATHDAWHARFGHLYGYGASYYSYLFDRVIAQKIIHHLFQNNSHSMLSRQKGELIKKFILQPGGSKDPWLCLSNVLGNQHPELLDHPNQAVQLVSNWGLWKS